MTFCRIHQVQLPQSTDLRSRFPSGCRCACHPFHSKRDIPSVLWVLWNKKLPKTSLAKFWKDHTITSLSGGFGQSSHRKKTSLKYISSTFSRSTSAFQRSWSMCCQRGSNSWSETSPPLLFRVIQCHFKK